MFNKSILDFPINLFDELSKSTKFDNITNGRNGAILFDNKNNLVPLVRSTTVYHIPNQKFLPIHYHIIDKIKVSQQLKPSNNIELEESSQYNNLEFNNAMIEIYNREYCTMGFHTDQSLDLSENSYICLFSCYDDPTTKNLRKLKIKNRITNKCYDILLNHNSIVIFSTDTNRKHLHKIILDESNTTNNLWLGITFRQSKTFISFNNELPYFVSTGKILTLANENQKKEYFKCRGLENSSIDYTYPEINYTISVGDILFSDQ